MLIKRNNLMTAALAVLVLMAFTPQAGFAQTSAPQATAQQGRDPLGLTAAQITKIKKARKDVIEPQLTALNKNPKLTDAQRRAKFQTIESSYEAILVSILTPAQRKIYMARSNAINAKRNQVVDNGIAVAKLSKQIDAMLSPEQRKKIAAVRSSANQQGEPIIKDKTMSLGDKEAKLSAIDKDAEEKVLNIMPAAVRPKFQQLITLTGEGYKLISEYRALLHN
jgi:hypothetical protein